MDENTATFIILGLLLVMLLIVPPMRVRRSVNSMIKKFRQEKAIDEKSAKTAEELDIRITTVTPTTTFFGGGDPSHAAMSALREAGVIIVTSDGKYYLSEAKLSRSKWGQSSQ